MGSCRSFMCQKDREGKDAEIERLNDLLRGTGANRYWEGRWRDEKAENERLRAALKHARIDLNAARIVVEAIQKSTAYGLRQTLEKVEAALGDQQTGGQK